MLYTSRSFAAFGSFRTEVTKTRGHRNKIRVYLVRTYRDQFMNYYTRLAILEIMLLLAGNLAGVAAGAPIVLYQ